MSWGCNDEGALGRNTSVEDSETTPGVVEIPEENAEIYSISAGGSHSALLLSNGNVYSWGTFRVSYTLLTLKYEIFIGTLWFRIKMVIWVSFQMEKNK